MKKRTPHKSRIALIVVLSILGVLILAGAAFYIWTTTPLPAMPEAISAMQTDKLVDVTATHGWLVFSPKLAIQTLNPAALSTGFIFYPGARVDYRAYAPAAREIAARGYLVVIVPMPLNLAIFGAEKASDVIAFFPKVQHWAIGGHSLGGAMAAQYAAAHPALIQGLIFWAAYPASDNDLSKTHLKVVSISGSLDGLATPDKVQASAPILPPNTTWVVIQGGNHAQFGWYGDQPGDQTATTPRQVQTNVIVQSTVNGLSALILK